jgi:hypothetical protein
VIRILDADLKRKFGIEQKDVPIGDAYRERVKGYVSRLAVL